MNNGPDRRTVMGALAASAALSGTAEAALPRAPYRVGVVGSGWFGKLNATSLMQVAPVEVTALCDVDTNMLHEAQGILYGYRDSQHRQTRRAALYSDYRRMLAEQHFDIVIVGTPDHWHALPAIEALNHGAHVYLEKPVTVDVTEGQAIVAAARRNNKVVQVGTQRRTAPFAIEARDRVIKSGMLGRVRLVDVYCYFHQRLEQAPGSVAPPAGLDWDTYCGPAPLIDYVPHLHPRNWRSFDGFGNGYAGDVGVHMIDLARWALELGWPSMISSQGGALMNPHSVATVPDTQTASFKFGDVLMTWTNRQWGHPPNRAEPWGAAINGENGTLNLYASGYEYIPNDPSGQRLSARLDMEEGRFPTDAALQGGDKGLQVLTRHNMRDFLHAIDTGGRPASDIEQGYMSTSCCILANTSLKLGRTIHWDGATQRVVGDDEAQAALTRPYRAPWRHPQAS